MARFTPADSLAAIDVEADRYGIPRAWAEAIAHVEDPPLDPYAIGDQGTSFGIYMLHVGGELGNHSAAWAFDPRNNAHTALGVLAQTIASHPSEHDPGALAALAQRPADPAGYAMKVDSQLHAAPAGDASGSGQNVDIGFHIPGLPTVPGLPSIPIVPGLPSIPNPFTSIDVLGRLYNGLTSGRVWIRIGLAVGGFVLVLVGVKVLLGGAGGVPIPIPV